MLPRRSTLHRYLLAVIAGLIGVCLQMWHQARRDAAERHREEIREARRVAETLSTRLDRRLYRMQRLAWAIRNKRSQQATRTMWNDYIETLHEWNEHYDATRVQLRHSFGRWAEAAFETELAPRFTRIGRRLEQMGTHPDRAAGQLSSATREIRSLSDCVYLFNNALATAVDERLVGGLRSADSLAARAFANESSRSPSVRCSPVEDRQVRNR
jgi:hypothetical protein